MIELVRRTFEVDVSVSVAWAHLARVEMWPSCAHMPTHLLDGGMYQINDPGVHALTIEPGDRAYFGLGWFPYCFNPDKGADGYLGCVQRGSVTATLADGRVAIASPARVRLPFCPPWGASVTTAAPSTAFTIASPLGPSLGG